jgi:hypothetical protein
LNDEAVILKVGNDRSVAERIPAKTTDSPPEVQQEIRLADIRLTQAGRDAILVVGCNVPPALEYAIDGLHCRQYDNGNWESGHGA